MKSLVIIIIVALVEMAGCNNTNKKEIRILPGTTDRVTLHDDTNRSLARQPISFSNPCIMAGSTFLNYFMALIRTQNYDEALRFTASCSIIKYGSAAILQLYRSMKINYSPKLQSIKICGDTTYMRYGVSIFSTRTFRDIKVIVEHDTSRLVLPDWLGKFLK